MKTVLSRIAGVYLVGMALFWAGPASAQEPPGQKLSGPADFYHRLHTQRDIPAPVGTQVLKKVASCCDKSDCHKREVRYFDGVPMAHIVESFETWRSVRPEYERYLIPAPGKPGYVVFDHWVAIPPGVDIKDADVLTHPYRPLQMVGCWDPWWGFICRVPGQTGG